MQYVIINNQLLASDKATISIHDRGFRYGDSVFETIAVHTGVPYQFDWHIERLRKGLNAIKINANLHKLNEQCRTLLRENKISQGVLRIQVSRGVGSKGYLPDSSHAHAGATVVIETTPLPPIPDTGVSLWKSSYSKPSPKSMPTQYKLGQGLNSILARMEAAEHNCFDALLLNDQSQICETSSGNIFWFADKMLYTPSLTCGALEGSMRANVIRLSEMPVREIEADIEILKKAEAVFVTNALWKILPIQKLMPVGTIWKTNPIISQLQKRIDKDMVDYTKNNSARW